MNMNNPAMLYSELTLLPWEAQERKDQRKEAALDEAPQDPLLLRRVGRVPCVGLAAEPADQHRLPVGEAVEAELAMVRPGAALAHATERQMRVRQLQNVMCFNRKCMFLVQRLIHRVHERLRVGRHR